MGERFKPLSEDHEIAGWVMAFYKNAINSADLAPFFEAHGLGQIDPQKWYPAQTLVDVFNDMNDSLNMIQGMFNFVTFGMQIGRALDIPPGIDRTSPEQMLNFLASLPTSTARGSQPGYVKVEMITPTYYQIRARTVLPDDMGYGWLYAFASRFAPRPDRVSVTYPPGGTRRDLGDADTLMDLRWD